MFVFVRGRAVVVMLVVAGLLGGVTASSVAAATSTTVTWQVSSLSAGQVKSLSAVASSNSNGVKTWSKTGSCVLSPKSNPPKLTMGTGSSCTLTLKIAKSGKYPAKTSTKKITRKPSCANGGVCAVGNTGPGGGIIYYVDLTRATGSQYFEAACAGWSDGTCGGLDLTDPEITWCGYLTPITGADGTAIGDGEQNTTDIVTSCATDGTAAKFVDALVLDGESDWFLPSKDELNALCKWAYNDTVHAVCNNDGLGSLSLTYGGFSSASYWSSSQFDANSTWNQYFTVGLQYDLYNYYIVSVRPVRAF